MQFGAHPYVLFSKEAPGVTPKDIAHSLSQLNRFTGHSREPFSVARHSYNVSMMLNFDPWVAMYGLVHDVPETVTNDLSHPLKEALFSGLFGWFVRRRYKRIERVAEAALFEVLGIPHPIPEDIKVLVKRADNAAVLAEKRDVMPSCERLWDMVPGNASHVEVTPTKTPRQDAALFLDRYVELARHLNISPKDWNERS